MHTCMLGSLYMTSNTHQMLLLPFKIPLNSANNGYMCSLNEGSLYAQAVTLIKHDCIPPAGDSIKQ